MIKKTLLFLVLLVTIFPLTINAYSEYIIAGGQNIGIQLKSSGIMIVGFYKVDDEYIAKDSGLLIGDIITTINDTEVLSVTELSNIINNSNGSIKIGYIRGNITEYTNLKLTRDNNTYKTGIYVKDTISGIGTLTYIDPNTNLFGALGHEILDKNTGKILDISGGNIFSSEVTNIIPSTNGVPGEKNALIDSKNIFGEITENTNQGIYGQYTEDFSTQALYKVADPSLITKGEAIIRTVLEGNNIQEFTINITKISDGDTKNILFEITDEELLDKTGGVIQGMSGSPIIQNDMIIGAVTHVIVDSPKKGYGIFITNMLEQGEN